MRIGIASNIIKYYLKDVYFINGTAYAGKSTMVHMLAEKYGMIECGENYHMAVSRQVSTLQMQPASSYFSTMSGWEEFLNRTPEQYAAWIDGTSREAAELELLMLIRIAQEGKPVFVDTNIHPETLREISDYNHVAIMLSPQSTSVDRFFDRSDPDKQFLFRQIELCPDPELTMSRFRASIARINNPENYRRFEESGFFTLVRDENRTQEETCDLLAKHFKLI